MQKEESGERKHYLEENNHDEPYVPTEWWVRQ